MCLRVLTTLVLLCTRCLSTPKCVYTSGRQRPSGAGRLTNLVWAVILVSLLAHLALHTTPNLRADADAVAGLHRGDLAPNARDLANNLMTHTERCLELLDMLNRRDMLHQVYSRR